MQRVTSLEPRTPHQPGKLQKLSKNDYRFTLFIFRVNENCRSLSAEFSIECRRFTGPCSKVGAVHPSQASVTCANTQFLCIFLFNAAELCAKRRILLVKISPKPCWIRHFRGFLPNEPRQEQKLKSQRTAAARAEGSGCAVSLFSPRQGTMPVSGNIS